MIVAYVVGALWIVTHTITTEIPVTSRAPKPLSCQLCLSGWVCIVLGIVTLALYNNPTAGLGWMFIWSTTVFIEALYQRLRTFFI